MSAEARLKGLGIDLPAPLALAPAVRAHWDRRFAVRVSDTVAEGAALRPLGRGGARGYEPKSPLGRALKAVPAPARASLPVLARGGEVFSCPVLAYDAGPGPEGRKQREFAAAPGVSVRFRPASPISLAGFCVA